MYKTLDDLIDELESIEIPQKPLKPSPYGLVTADDYRDYASKLETFNVEWDLYQTRMNEYYELKSDMAAEIKEWVLSDLSIKNHPKADLLYSKAYEQGHSSGFREIYNCALDLVDLLD